MNPWLTGLLFACVGLGAAALTSSFMAQSARTPSQERRLARIERQLALIMQRLDIEEPESPMSGVIAELEQGNKIKAIKIYREQTGAGLAEAKSAVEVIAGERGL
jgi:ribosomal protein L7/L12